jgi:hypothetical protein
MFYVNSDEAVSKQASMMDCINKAFVRSKGSLRLILENGRVIEGRYYGAHCSASSSMKVTCQVSLGEEDGECPGVYDILQIERVDAIV